MCVCGVCVCVWRERRAPLSREKTSVCHLFFKTEFSKIYFLILFILTHTFQDENFEKCIKYTPSADDKIEKIRFTLAPTPIRTCSNLEKENVRHIIGQALS